MTKPAATPSSSIWSSVNLCSQVKDWRTFTAYSIWSSGNISSCRYFRLTSKALSNRSISIPSMQQAILARRISFPWQAISPMKLYVEPMLNAIGSTREVSISIWRPSAAIWSWLLGISWATALQNKQLTVQTNAQYCLSATMIKNYLFFSFSKFERVFAWCAIWNIIVSLGSQYKTEYLKSRHYI